MKLFTSLAPEPLRKYTQNDSSCRMTASAPLLQARTPEIIRCWTEKHTLPTEGLVCSALQWNANIFRDGGRRSPVRTMASIQNVSQGTCKDPDFYPQCILARSGVLILALQLVPYHKPLNLQCYILEIRYQVKRASHWTLSCVMQKKGSLKWEQKRTEGTEAS